MGIPRRRYRSTKLRDTLAQDERSLRWAGRKAGVSHVTIYYVIEGRSTMAEGAATRLAAALGLPVDVLFAEVMLDDRAA